MQSVTPRQRVADACNAQTARHWGLCLAVCNRENRLFCVNGLLSFVQVLYNK